MQILKIIKWIFIYQYKKISTLLIFIRNQTLEHI